MYFIYYGTKLKGHQTSDDGIKCYGIISVKSQWGSSCMENDFFTIMCLSSVYFHSSED